MGGTGAEEGRGAAEQGGELGEVARDLVVDLAGVAGAGDAVGRAAGDGEGAVGGAVVGDLEERVGGEALEGRGVGVDPAGVQEEGGGDAVGAEGVHEGGVVA